MFSESLFHLQSTFLKMKDKGSEESMYLRFNAMMSSTRYDWQDYADVNCLLKYLRRNLQRTKKRNVSSNLNMHLFLAMRL